MGESSFWYRPTRVVPDQRPLNGRRWGVNSPILSYLCKGIWSLKNPNLPENINIKFCCNGHFLCEVVNLRLSSSRHFCFSMSVLHRFIIAGQMPSFHSPNSVRALKDTEAVTPSVYPPPNLCGISPTPVPGCGRENKLIYIRKSSCWQCTPKLLIVHSAFLFCVIEW